MGQTTQIQWCDHTYNPWRGCRKVAPECLHCYITTTVPFRTSGQKHGADRVRAGEDYLKEPLRWNKKPWICDHCGLASATHGGICPSCKQVGQHRAKVFCLSLGDWLDDENVPIEWLYELLKVIQATPNLIWLLLTKRPGNFATRVGEVADNWASSCELAKWWAHREIPPANVWVGVSAGADQKTALDIPAYIHFLSCEPMLQALDTTHASRFDWIIFGGESDTQMPARECHEQWIFDGIVFCRLHGIAPFVKQLGSNVVMPGNFQRPLKHKKGGDPAEWPARLRIREFPAARVHT
jgi:protein gp37